ncbi:hypothetical protein HHL28_04460 [Aerophototrophica crusticola]|uniref:TNase-like domain-containing protein n=1 Tax=Aerophototrophica crusticola TaxID=1709002 RepID=A0A858R4X0_9PROT|nr:hypothetical protein HHL28_04460 [Rhodospirillaceae bacterium B3]
MRKVLVGVALGLVAGAAGANPLAQTQGPVTVAVLRVVDGETLAVRAYPWPGAVLEDTVRLRNPPPEGSADCRRALLEQAIERANKGRPARTMVLVQVERAQDGGAVTALMLPPMAGDVVRYGGCGG